MNPDVRALFPGARRRVYLDVAAKGLVPVTVRDHVEAYLDDQVEGRADKAELRRQVEATRDAVAELVGAASKEIAVTKNVSEAINLFAASLPWCAGDNVVICPALEHPNNIYPWYNVARRHDVEIRSVPCVDGVLPVEAMAEAVDDGTRVVTFSSVTSVPGLAADVTPLVEAARRVGALTMVDAAQSVGALHTDVRALDVDAMAMTAQKCLLSLFGRGFLYVRGTVADGLVPGHLARFGVELDAPETAYSDGPLRYRTGALRFDLGNYNYLGVSATGVSLALLLRLGSEHVEAHVRRLARRLADGLVSQEVPVVGGDVPEQLAHIVTAGTFSPGMAGGRAEPDEMESLHRVLTEREIAHSVRNGMLRLSVGVYNDDDDVDEVLDAVRRWRRSA